MVNKPSWFQRGVDLPIQTPDGQTPCVHVKANRGEKKNCPSLSGNITTRCQICASRWGTNLTTLHTLFWNYLYVLTRQNIDSNSSKQRTKSPWQFKPRGLEVSRCQISNLHIYRHSYVRPPQHELHSRAHTREETEVEDEQWTRVLPATNAPAAERPVCWLY